MSDPRYNMPQRYEPAPRSRVSQRHRGQNIPASTVVYQQDPDDQYYPDQRRNDPRQMMPPESESLIYEDE